jgi:hypothetical protein
MPNVAHIGYGVDEHVLLCRGHQSCRARQRRLLVWPNIHGKRGQRVWNVEVRRLQLNLFPPVRGSTGFTPTTGKTGNLRFVPGKAILLKETVNLENFPSRPS